MPTFQFWIGVVESTCTTPVNARRLKRMGMLDDQMLKKTIEAPCFCAANIEFNKFRGLEPYKPMEEGCDETDCIMAKQCGNCRWWEQVPERGQDGGGCRHPEAHPPEQAWRYDWCQSFERKEWP
jgi:hypothetical protein